MQFRKPRTESEKGLNSKDQRFENFGIASNKDK